MKPLLLPEIGTIYLITTYNINVARKNTKKLILLLIISKINAIVIE
jgi:hypothetical protein